MAKNVDIIIQKLKGEKRERDKHEKNKWAQKGIDEGEGSIIFAVSSLASFGIFLSLVLKSITSLVSKKESQ